jgi:CRISPR-associated endonuclease Csn1
MKKILGLDLGTNSIGWAVVNADVSTRKDDTTYLKPNSISCAGSRIIPMSADILGDFDKGNSISQTAERTRLRMMRRLLERNHLRRERLLRVLKVMNFLPEHYDTKVSRYGKFMDDSEPKLPWYMGKKGKMEFLFQDSFHEMLDDFMEHHPQMMADGKKVPYDWTIYYLRKKALTQRITKEELAWILLQFNQKRGYYQLRGEEEEENANESVEIISAKSLSVEKKEKNKKKEKK